MYTGPGGGMYTGPGGGAYTGPGGGLYTGPGGGAYSGPQDPHIKRMWPPIPILLQFLDEQGEQALATIIRDAYGLHGEQG